MTKEAMTHMTKTIRRYRQIENAKVLAEKWNEFFSGAGEIPGKPDDVTEGEEDEDVYREEVIVLYAELSNRFHLIREVGTIEEIMLSRGISGFISHFITDELMAMYPKEYARSHKDGSVLATGPLYIIHPVTNKDETDACMDLGTVEFCEALTYLTSRAIYVKSNAEATGFLLEKED